MTQTLPSHSGFADPAVPDWRRMSLPDTWPDRTRFYRPRDLLRLARHFLGLARARVDLPHNTPGRDRIPKYILQEFHNLPNGNYSRRFTRGYITGFDRVMLGHIQASHARIVRDFRGLQHVLDLGCGGGGLAGRLKASGIADVWGLDPSPYLLQHAAHDWPDVHFVQGVAEDTGFAPARFDGIALCYLLHEIPPRYLHRSLRECHRLLPAGGLLAICEPSPLQARQSLRALWRQFGWQGLYFRFLARFVHEPFLAAWHRQDIPALLEQHGFTVLEDDIGLPNRYLLARRR